jgi:hypothetical protein
MQTMRQNARLSKPFDYFLALSSAEALCFVLGGFIAIFFFLKISSYIKSPPQTRHKNHSRKGQIRREIGGGGVHVTCSKLKLIKYVSTEEKDDILEELD